MRHVVGATLFLLVAALDSSAQTPIGGEFRVNTFTTGFQDDPAMGMEPDGDWVVVWSSDAQDGSLRGIYAQRFDAAGSAVGGEFRVNSYTTSAQYYPDVAMRSNGEFVVVWESDGPDGNRSAVRGQRYDASGNAVGGEFQVNSITTSWQEDPRVSIAPDGRFVVVWTYKPNSWEIYGRLFDAGGSPIGADFLVNAYTPGPHRLSDVAMEASGSTFVVVWEEHQYNTSRDGDGEAVFGRRFHSNGVPIGADFLVNTYTTGRQRNPTISASPTGGFVVAWKSLGRDGNQYGVAARRYNASGNPIGDEFVVNTYTTGHQGDGILTKGIDIAHDGSGNFVVTWNSFQDGSLRGVYAQRYAASGAPLGGEYQVNTFTTNEQRAPVVGADAAGRITYAWESATQDGSWYGVYARRFGDLSPAALAVDTTGNQVLESGETVDVRPSWSNFTGASQTFTGTLSNFTGPAGSTYTITDSAGDYGTVADGVVAQCSDCYAVSINTFGLRPATHWDTTALEALSGAQGQQKTWSLHVGDSFTDVPPTSPYYRYVETLLHRGVTAGCGATTYCPTTTTNRQEMAVFVLIAKEGPGYVPPACGTPMFADVPASSAYCPYIEELARRGVVAGCGGGNYCPTATVSREAMAVFVIRTESPVVPPACVPPNVYGDVPETSPFCRWIEELASRGPILGCGTPGNYCPTASVTREQMANFITVGFGLTLYGP